MSMPVKFISTEIPAVLEVHCGVAGDDRGFFSEIYSEKTWTEVGYAMRFVQDNISQSVKGTLRGLHYQNKPHAQGKLIRVMRGSIYDVAVDIRKGSPTFGKWVGREMSAKNKMAMWVPEGFAHGFIALEDETLIMYKCTDFYAPQSQHTILWNDPKVNIQWPMEPLVLSEKDAVAPVLDEADYNFVYSA
ncbi:MAG: dTDP-4-dehydrorhamnose 3,5-epimerase [Candidatus Hydrogenedentota bacterium]